MGTLMRSGIENRLLKALSDADFATLAPQLELVPLKPRDVLHFPARPNKYVHFPETAVCSLSAIGRRGAQIDAGLIGREGFSGIAHLALAQARCPLRCTVLLGGEALRIESDLLSQFIEHMPSVRAAVQRYQYAAWLDVAYCAFAYGTASVERRIARWLLMLHDRRAGELHLTHEQISHALSVRRAGVTVALRHIEKLHAIELRRGVIRLTARHILEELAGDCYGAPEAEYARLIAEA